MRKSVFIYILFFLSNTIHAQTIVNKDSLFMLLPAVKEDSNSVLVYVKIGQQYETNEPETAKQYYRIARDLRKKD